MILALALYVAHWLVLPLAPPAIATGAAVAAITTIGSVSLPGQVSFLTSIAPICVAMGVPIEPLALLIAVEMVPDLVRTVGNVTMDVAATTAIARLGQQAKEGAAHDDLSPPRAGDGLAHLAPSRSDTADQAGAMS